MDNKKMTFKNLSASAKLEHIWEYYKFPIIVGLVIAIIVFVIAAQLVGRVEPDANIMYAGQYDISAQAVNDMQVSLAEKVNMTDTNDDGKKSIDYVQYLLFGEISDPSKYVNSITMQENIEGYNTEILAGDSMILLLDEYYYNKLVEQSLIMPFTEYLDEVPEKAADAYGIKLSDLDIYKLDGFMKFSPDTYVCLRVQKTYGDFGKGEANALLERNKQVFCDMLNYKYEEDGSK